MFHEEALCEMQMIIYEYTVYVCVCVFQVGWDDG